MKNIKKPLLIAGIVLDVGITVFLLVVSIIMLAATSKVKYASEIDPTTFIGYLQTHTTLYLWAFVVPLFVLLAANIIGLVIYVKKSTKKEPVQVNDLTDEQREELRRQLLAELSGGAKQEEKPAENAENNKE